MSTPERPARWRLPLFFALAIAAHALLVPLLATELSFLPDGSKHTAPVRVVNVTPQLRQQLAQAKEAMQAGKQRVVARMDEKQVKPAAPAPKAPEPERERPAGPTVDVPPTADNRPPDDARFSSEHNTRVERETKARYQTPPTKNVTNEPSVAERNEAKVTGEKRDARALEVGPEKEGAAKAREAAAGGEKALEVPRLAARDRLALKLDPELGNLRNQTATEEMKGNSDRLRLSTDGGEGKPEQQGSAPEQGPNAVSLIPNLGVLARIAGAPDTTQYLPDVEEGDGTFLNTRQFKYASFFNRLRHGIYSHWRPMDEYRRRDPTGNIYGFRSRYTELQVTLNADGSLKKCEVARSSGIDFLDGAAKTAFEEAQPFPNPPKGLVDPNGEITFGFGFHIEFNGNGLQVPF